MRIYYISSSKPEKASSSQMHIQKERIEKSATRMRQSIEDQGKTLAKQGAQISIDLKRIQEEVERSVSDLKTQQRHLKMQCSSLRSQNRSIRENFKRRGFEIEAEIDRLQHRLGFIRDNPNQVDSRLINISLVLTKKSKLIEAAVDHMRKNLHSFQEWLMSKPPA